jgi:hypothetical protein
MSEQGRLRKVLASEGFFFVGLGTFFLLYNYVFNPLVRGRESSLLVTAVTVYFIAMGAVLLLRPRWRPYLVASGGVVLAGFSLYVLLWQGFNWWVTGSLIVGLWFTLALFVPPEEGEAQSTAPADDSEADDEEEEQAAPAAPRPRRRKKKRRPIAEVFTRYEGDKLVTAVFGRILRYHGDPPDFEEMSEPERNVLLAYHVMGIVGNGGFNYLFEGNLSGDPDYTRTLRAYEQIGAANAAAAVRDALALFPGGRAPADIDERLQVYRSGPGDRRHAIDCRFWDAHEEIDKCLESYLRANAAAFRHLDGPPRPARPVRPAHRSRRPHKPAPVPAEESTDADEAPPEHVLLELLPHWARVAFAARCGRHVLPLLRANWPGALPERAQAVLTALELTERSAREGQPAPGLRDAVMNAMATAGGALLGLYGAPREMADTEPLPPDGNAATRAAAVAKAAESAARAASGPPDESLGEALAALSFARSAAEDSRDLRYAVLSDLTDLGNAALKQGWDDMTPVPADVWKPLT